MVRQKNQGVTEARGEFIAFFDADDLSEPQRLAAQIDFFNANPGIGVLGTQVAVIDAVGALKGYRKIPTTHFDILAAMSRVVPLAHSSVMMRTGALREVGGYSFEEYPAAEDYDLWSRLARAGVQFANLKDVLLRYRIHADQIKCTCLRGSIRAVLRVKQLYWKDSMTLGSRCQMIAEHMLLWMPEWMIWQLLIWWLYRDEVPN